MANPSWGLCTYRVAGTDALGALRHADGAVVAVPGPGYRGLIAAMAEFDELEQRLAAWDPTDLPAVPDAVLLAPLRYPPKLICAGVNYGSHMAEMGAGAPDPDWAAWFFLKPPTTTVIGPDAAIEIDPDPDEQVDWEGELGIVIGRGGRGIAAAGRRRARRGLHGRQRHLRARAPSAHGAPHDAFRYDWLASKAQDTFCPMGPAVTPRWLLPDPDDQRLRLWVNDELKQDERAGDMLVGWRELVAAASARVTLEPGDVIAAGTPAGVGMPRAEFLRPGDVVRVAIEGIGPCATRSSRAPGRHEPAGRATGVGRHRASTRPVADAHEGAPRPPRQPWRPLAHAVGRSRRIGRRAASGDDRPLSRGRPPPGRPR
jgi:2-keto-4-pentenoate hydratase/2-oxohepta-3-ene-1,7-dioic acid hydratase in catechol pathway